jgi:hypothetical protein
MIPRIIDLFRGHLDRVTFRHGQPKLKRLVWLEETKASKQCPLALQKL